MDNTACLWEAKTGKLIDCIRSDPKNFGFNQAIFSPDGKKIAISTSAGSAVLWNAETDSIVLLRGHKHIVISAAFSPDSMRVVTASFDNTARIWDAITGDQIRALDGHSGPINTAVFSSNGKSVLTASSDKTARIWDLDTGETLRVLSGHVEAVNSAIFSPDGELVVTTSDDNSARIWNQDSNDVKILRGHDAGVTSATFSSDGELILTASYDKTARLWDAGWGWTVGVLGGHKGRISSAVFSHDGRQVLTGSWDNTARLWKTVPLPPMVTLHGSHSRHGLPYGGLPRTSVRFSPDGARLMTVSNHTVLLSDATTGGEIMRLEDEKENFVDARLSPDRKQVLRLVPQIRQRDSGMAKAEHSSASWKATRDQLSLSRCRLTESER